MKNFQSQTSRALSGIRKHPHLESGNAKETNFNKRNLRNALHKIYPDFAFNTIDKIKAQKSTNCHKQELPWTHYCKEAVDVVKHRLEDFTICAGCLLISLQAQNLITGAEDMDTWCNYLLNSLGICTDLFVAPQSQRKEPNTLPCKPQSSPEVLLLLSHSNPCEFH